MTYYTKAKCAEQHVFNISLCYFKFRHSCRVSERREEKRERQVMPPLVLLIKFILLLKLCIIEQVNPDCNHFSLESVHSCILSPNQYVM